MRFKLSAFVVVGCLVAWKAAPAQETPASRTLAVAAAAAENSTAAEQTSAPDQADSPGPPAETTLTPEQVVLRDRIRRCLAYYFYRPESTQRRSPWAIMHVIMGFGVDSTLLADHQDVNAIAWLCANGPCYGMQLMYPAGRSVGVRMGPGYQGHSGQLLAILAQSRVKIDYPLVVQGQRLSLAELVRSEQLTCRSGTELTFKLIGLSHYLEPDAAWQSESGEAWDISRLIREELAQPVVGAACGGTHRLMGFSYAVRKCEKSGRPLAGQWLRAKEYLDQYHERTFKLQNADGSFSTNWFAGRGERQDPDRQLETHGHTLEWLIYSLPKDQLADQRLVRAVEFLTDLMWRYRGRDWEIGPKGHAIHALALYDERVFGGQPGQRAEQLASCDDGETTPDLQDRQLAQDRPVPASAVREAGGESSRMVRRRTSRGR